jgi:hypothetical protein
VRGMAGFSMSPAVGFLMSFDKRHWLARFRRRSIVVSKAKRMVDASIALFARFGSNDKIGDLVAMLA